MNAPSEQVWAKVGAQDRLRRGFDDASTMCWAPHFALRAPGDELQRRLVAEHVIGTFAAIAGLAAWTAQTQDCDPVDEMARARASVVAEELEDMAHALRRALDNYEGTED
jgi:hypothetical protein